MPIEPLSHRLRGQITKNQPTPPKLFTILTHVSLQFNVSILHIRGETRREEIVMARQAYMYIASKLTSHSLPSIGKEINRKAHKTIAHGIRRVHARMSTNREYADSIAKIIQSLNRQTPP